MFTCRWFDLHNIVYDSEYGTLKEDTYNFNETIFAISPVTTTRVVPSANTIRHPSRIQPDNYEYTTPVDRLRSPTLFGIHGKDSSSGLVSGRECFSGLVF